eukprot:scaffold20376_cov59-Phaeocystis_antarctica.AAC.1
MQRKGVQSRWGLHGASGTEQVRRVYHGSGLQRRSGSFATRSGYFCIVVRLAAVKRAGSFVWRGNGGTRGRRHSTMGTTRSSTCCTRLWGFVRWPSCAPAWLGPVSCAGRSS